VSLRPTIGQRLRPGAVRRRWLRVTYDKQRRRIEISATISDAVAQTLHNAEDLPQEVTDVTRRT